MFKSILLALVLVISLAPVTMAQPTEGVVTPVISLNENQRDGATLSNSIVVPLGSSGILRMRLTMPASVYADTTVYIFFRLYRLLPGNVWQIYSGTGWPAGDRVDPETGEVNPRPWFEIDLAPLAGATVRAELDVNKRIRVGAEVEVVTPN